MRLKNLYHPQKPFLLPSAKSKGINRPTVVFDIKDALVYRFCIEQIEDEIINKTRQKHIRGGIKITPNKKQGVTIFMRNGSKIGCNIRKT